MTISIMAYLQSISDHIIGWIMAHSIIYWLTAIIYESNINIPIDCMFLFAQFSISSQYLIDKMCSDIVEGMLDAE